MARVAFVSSYPPRTTGLATFTDHLGRVAGDREIVALDAPDERPAYPIEVHHRVRVGEPAEFARVARSLGSCVDVASIQFDPDTWGPDDGEAVLDFIAALEVPSAVTLHAIPPEPTARQRAVLLALLQGTTVGVAMSRAGVQLLSQEYGVDPVELEIIPYGVPDLPPTDAAGSDAAAAAMDLAGRQVILTFGMLRPSKGCELMIEALPAVVARWPRSCYVIVGATDPDTARRDGESYRRSLEARVAALGLADHVRFVNRFVGRVELQRWLQAAAVVVVPHPGRHEVSSGTIAYAMAAGRAVVATPHPLAMELLDGGAGIVLPERSAAALAAAVSDLLGDPESRAAIGSEAHERTREAVWSSVGTRYRDLFTRVAAGGRALVERGGPPARRTARVRAR